LVDSYDLKALALLATDGRASWSQVARRLGFSAPSAAERVRQLEKRGVIRGYEARLDPKSLGYGLTAFVAVNLPRERDRAVFLRAVARTPEILECHHTAGEDDYILKVRCKNTDDLEQVIARGLKKSVEVRTRSAIVLSTAKETAVLPLFAKPIRPAGNV
jgi:Lrp/AsnC family leucine-responsive transcriptional regulator